MLLYVMVCLVSYAAYGVIALQQSSDRRSEYGGEGGGHDVVKDFFGAVGVYDAEGDPAVVVDVVFGVEGVALDVVGVFFVPGFKEFLSGHQVVGVGVDAVVVGDIGVPAALLGLGNGDVGEVVAVEVVVVAGGDVAFYVVFADGKGAGGAEATPGGANPDVYAGAEVFGQVFGAVVDDQADMGLVFLYFKGAAVLVAGVIFEHGVELVDFAEADAGKVEAAGGVGAGGVGFFDVKDGAFVDIDVGADGDLTGKGTEKQVQNQNQKDRNGYGFVHLRVYLNCFKVVCNA